jgi:hypothetical protein
MINPSQAGRQSQRPMLDGSVQVLSNVPVIQKRAVDDRDLENITQVLRPRTTFETRALPETTITAEIPNCNVSLADIFCFYAWTCC